MRISKIHSLSLKTRILLILFVVVGVYGGIDYLIQRVLIYPRFLAMEEDSARENMMRCVEAITGEIRHLDTLAHDWAAWNDTYRFIQGEEPDFVDSNMMPETYGINRLNLLYIVGLDGSVAAGSAWDLDTGSPMDIPEFSPSSIPSAHPLLIGGRVTEALVDAAVKGILLTKSGPMLVSARPILTSTNEGPPRGTLIMGRLLNEAKIQSLIEQTRIHFDVFPVGGALSAEAQDLLGGLTPQFPITTRINDRDFLYGYAMMTDVEGAPALLLRARIARDISAQGARVVWIALLTIAVTGVASLLVLNMLLAKVVFAPIRILTKHAARITETDDLSARLNMRHQHEIGMLGHAFDRMVARLEEQTGQLAGANETLTAEVRERKRVQTELRKSEAYLQAILDTIQSGVLVSDPATDEILHVNPYAAHMIGEIPETLIGRKRNELMDPIAVTGATDAERYKGICQDDCLLKTRDAGHLHIRRSGTTIEKNGKSLFLENLQDISDIKGLLEKQNIQIASAGTLLGLIDAPLPRHILIPEDRQLFIDSAAAPCYALGGDHFFCRTLSGRSGSPRTIISLKDQSGHEVQTVLKAIGTDMLHQSLLCKHEEMSLQAVMTRVNDDICASGLLGDEGFFTSITLDIDHASLTMRYLSTGHPPFLLIRDGAVCALPERGAPGANLPAGFLKNASFSSGEMQLAVGDCLILYSDGLTDMPFKHLGAPLDTERLMEMVRKILLHASRKGVSEVMRALLREVAELSTQEVVPEEKNTSDDDVTLIGIEVEGPESVWERSFRLESAEMLAAAVSAVVEDISSRLGLLSCDSPMPKIFAFLEEGMINAWRHGNRCDPAKTTTVRCHRGNDIRIDIIDEGEGVDITALPDPTRPENLLKATGRGIFIMKRMADAVFWEDGGRHVVAFFRLQ